MKPKTVDQFLKTVSAEKLPQIELLRECVLSIDPDLKEHLKWNAPSYVHDGEDRITFNLMNKEGVVKLVLHMGTARPEDKKAAPIMQDVSGLIEWKSNIRGVMSFDDLDDVKSKLPAIKTILKNWLSIPA